MTADSAITALALAAFGSLLLLFSYGFAHRRLPGRTGFSNSKFNRWYHHFYRAQGWPLRNGVFICPPFGLASLLGALMYVAAPRLPAPREVEGVQAVLWLVVYASLVLPVLALVSLSFLALVRPPTWLKPAWLLEEEKRRKAGLPSLVPVPPEGDRPIVSRRDVFLVFAMTIIVVTGVAFFRWPPALLFGPAVALPMIARGIRPPRGENDQGNKHGA